MSHRLYQTLLENSRIPIIVAHGPAGTGKTLMACKAAGASTRHDRVILTRPAVSVDEQHGYLPGALDQKMGPWIAPMTDYLPWQTKYEVCPLAFMRGRTFHRSWIIADEMQNSTPSQMRMVLTRIGNDSKLVITGDTDQHDRGFERNGLLDLVERLEANPIPGVGVIRFTEDDIMRHEIIKHILRLYKS